MSDTRVKASDIVKELVAIAKKYEKDPDGATILVVAVVPDGKEMAFAQSNNFCCPRHAFQILSNVIEDVKDKFDSAEDDLLH